MRTLAIVLALSSPCFAQLNSTITQSNSSQSCPIEVVKLNPSHESFWNNVATSRTYGNTTVSEHNKFLEVKVKNLSDKTIRGIKFVTAYYDSTEDLTTIPHTWGLHDEIKAGATATGNWDANVHQSEAAIGWVVLPLKVLFSDGTTWEQHGNYCEYEWWKDKKHPRVNKAPSLVGLNEN